MAVEIQPEELRERLESGEEVYVLDVREDDEVAAWAFPGAAHIPLGQLASRTDELPTGGTIVVLCHAGVRSQAAADALVRAGWSAESLAGGIVAWAATDPSPDAG